MAAIVLVKQLGKGHYFESPIEFKKGEAVRIGNVIFVPALLVGIITFIIGFFTKLGALVGHWYCGHHRNVCCSLHH